MTASVAPETEFRGRLAAEVEAWRREGLVTPEQAARILARYETRAAAARAVRLGSVATLISVVGAAVLGAGVVLFFAANWERLDAWFKVVLVFVGTAAAYGVGYWLQFRSRLLPRVGAALILLGAILFQAGIFLLAQIYNMPLDSPIALLLGAAGILPLAYVVGSRFVLFVGLVDGLVWIALQIHDRYGNNGPENYAIPLVYLLMGVLTYSAGHVHRLRRDPARFAAVYEALGLITIFGAAYVLSFGGFWDNARQEDLARVHVPWWFAGVNALSLLGAASLAVWTRTAARDDDQGRRDWPSHGALAWAEAAVFATIALSSALVAVMPEWTGVYPALFNTVYFGLALFICSLGYLEGEARFVNIGIPFLAFGIVTRYIDYFWGLLPRSAFFIAGGVLLLVVAAGLEHLRQRLLAGSGGGERPGLLPGVQS